MIRRLLDAYKYKILISLVLIIYLIIVGMYIFNEVPTYEYKYDSYNECYVLSDVNGNEEAYHIPSTYRGKIVGGIGKKAFSNHTKLKSLSFSENNNVYFINSGAFYNCKGLEEFIFPNEIKILENNLFNDCTNLKKVILNDNIKKINGSMFFNCINLTDINLNNITNIGTYGFYNCYKLNNQISNSVTLEIDALKNCNITIK